MTPVQKSKTTQRTLSGFDLAAIVLSVAAIFAAYLVADRIFEQVPHLEDEIAYVWQAKAMADGVVTVPSPNLDHKFLIPFVVDFEGQRFGKYPLGWPAVLSVGIRLGLRSWVNPLLAGLAIWFSYRLGKKLLGEIAGLIAAALTLTSPFFLLNAGSLLSHPLGLVLSLMFVISWWDIIHPPEDERLPKWLPPVTAGLSLGALAITRPFTALGAALPLMVLGLIWFVKGDAARRKGLITIAGLGALIGLLQLGWQAVATGDPLLNPYELWWPYDKVGFGPGYGVTEIGHTLRQAIMNTRFSLFVGWHDLYGWAGYSWLLIPFGLWAIRRNGRMLWTFSVVLSLLGFYMAYWIGAWTFGPRYQFEGLFSLTLVSAAGLCWWAGWPHRPGEVYQPAAGFARFRRLGTAAFAAFLVAINLVFYVPPRLDSMKNLYNISRSDLVPFEQAADLTPALIVVHADIWTEYGALLELEDPFLTTPFIFVLGDQPGMVDVLTVEYPDRKIFHYYPDEPGYFYTGPKGN